MKVNGSFTAMMQKTRGKQNALLAPGLKNMLYKVTSRYTAKLTCCTKMLDPMTETKHGNFGIIYHTHTYDMYAWSHALGRRGCSMGPWV